MKYSLQYISYAKLPLLFVCAFFLGAFAGKASSYLKTQTEQTVSSESNNWGLSFQKEGERPVGNASIEELKEYNAYYAQNTDEKIIYLTFDAGYENGNTPAILDALKSHHVSATFFTVGNFLADEPALVERMLKEGHTIGNHTFTHPDMSKISTKESFSKELRKVEELYKEIYKTAISIGVGIVGADKIDEINILNATYEAMRQAVEKLAVRPQILLNDAVTIPQVHLPQVPIIKGDAKSVSIAAASIVAKVTRDRMMQEYDRMLPGYDFASNKGYGSAAHIEALKKLGPSPIHRATFIKNFLP